MHRQQHIIQPCLPKYNVPLYKRYFRFAQHRKGGPLRAAVFVFAIAALVVLDRVHPVRAA